MSKKTASKMGRRLAAFLDACQWADWRLTVEGHCGRFCAELRQVGRDDTFSAVGDSPSAALEALFKKDADGPQAAT